MLWCVMLKRMDRFVSQHPNLGAVVSVGLGATAILTLALAPKGEWRIATRQPSPSAVAKEKETVACRDGSDARSKKVDESVPEHDLNTQLTDLIEIQRQYRDIGVTETNIKNVKALPYQTRPTLPK